MNDDARPTATPGAPDSRQGAAQFPAQQQEPPGLTGHMVPVPDHGEDSYRGSQRLVGRRALITGGDSGIGRAVALAFAREGADVAFTYLPEERVDAEESLALIEAAGTRGLALAADLRDRATCDRVVDEVVCRFGGLEVLVNNAGYQHARDDGLTDMDDDQIDRVFRTNLYSLFWLTRAAVKHLKPGASIINVSSIQAYEPSTTLLDYAATKAAINNLTVNLAAELGPKGIRVNAVAPGPIWTPLQPATQAVQKVMHFGRTPRSGGRASRPRSLRHSSSWPRSVTPATYRAPCWASQGANPCSEWPIERGPDPNARP